MNELNNKTYIIGEIGQNHNGSVDIAKLIIDIASIDIIDNLFGNTLKGFNAVKLTKRDLKFELSNSKMNERYDSPNSFGKTYGEHRKKLELGDEQHFELYKYAKSKKLDFIETLCAPSCLSILKKFSPDYLKVASRDLTNLPLLNSMAETKIPMILSTGMSDSLELENALELINKYHNNISILHCLSQYPSEYKNINLKTILYLLEKYPEYQIGYSDHSIGISIPSAAVAMGAKIIEKHITIDRKMKGTDQSGSLERDGMYRMIRDIRNLELSLGNKEMFISESVNQSKIKLSRSIASKKFLNKGEIIKEKDLIMLSPGDGIKWSEKDKIIGKKILKDIKKHEIIYKDYVE